MAALGKILTADCLAKRGWPHNPTCRLCGVQQENAPHLLAACTFAVELWNMVLQRCGLPNTLGPATTTSSLLPWWERSEKQVPKIHQKAWNSLVQIVWWHTWKERNARIFDNKTSTVDQVMSRIKDDIEQWMAAGKTKIAMLIHRPRESD